MRTREKEGWWKPCCGRILRPPPRQQRWRGGKCSEGQQGQGAPVTERKLALGSQGQLQRGTLASGDGECWRERDRGSRILLKLAPNMARGAIQGQGHVIEG